MGGSTPDYHITSSYISSFLLLFKISADYNQRLFESE